MKYVVYFITVILFLMISTPALVTLKIINNVKNVVSSGSHEVGNDVV